MKTIKKKKNIEFKEAVKIAKNIYSNKIIHKNQFEILLDEIFYNLDNGLDNKPIQFTMKDGQIIIFKASDIINT